MKDVIFSNKFRFMHFEFEKEYRTTDNRKGSPHHYLAFMEEGHCRIVSDEVTIEIKQGDVFYIPDGLPYQSHWYGEPNIKFHSYGFKYFPETESNNFCLQVINCPSGLKERIKNIPFSNDPKSLELSIFYSCLSDTVPLLTVDTKGRDEQVYKDAMHYISTYPYATAPNIAKHCGVSESALYNAFKKVMGKTPNQIKQEVLCEKAALLLSSTDRSVQDISDSLGFSSTSYFRKVLFANTGKTPREIRKESAF